MVFYNSTYRKQSLNQTLSFCMNVHCKGFNFAESRIGAEDCQQLSSDTLSLVIIDNRSMQSWPFQAPLRCEFIFLRLQRVPAWKKLKNQFTNSKQI